MSRGLGQIEQAILRTLHESRQPLLADRWHPLLVQLYTEGPVFAAHQQAIARIRGVTLGPTGVDRVENAIREAVSDEVFRLQSSGSPLPQDSWEAVEFAARLELEAVHAESLLGDSLSELGTMMRSSEKPHAVEVSIQRAAKRLEDKSFIQRRYVTHGIAAKGSLKKERTFVCVRITPSADEITDAADLRSEAKQVHARHMLEGVTWIRRRGTALSYTGGEWDLDGYRQASDEWCRLEAKHRSDWKWLSWFENL